jgi:stage III sporulation protein AC/AD protein family
VRKGEGVMTIIQAAVLGITAVALAVQLKPLRQEYSVYLILAAGLVIGFLSISRLELILDTVRAIGSQIRVKNIYLGTLLKMVGITYIAEFASGICRDAGFSALGTQVEMFGKLSILAVSAPVLQALLETLQVFLS